jgi:hypothetical protein
MSQLKKQVISQGGLKSEVQHPITEIRFAHEDNDLQAASS